MNSYSHLALAKQLEPAIKPEDTGEYLWGSVVPDIRYLTGMPRNHTHLSRDQMKVSLASYPHLKSFLLGYLVHCLLDELDLSKIIGRKFPISLMRANFSQQKMAVLVELYYLETVRLNSCIQGTENDFLNILFLGVKMARLDEKAMSHVRSSIGEFGIVR